MTKKRIFLNFIPAIIVTCIIFGLSLQPGATSTEATGALSRGLAEMLSVDPGTTEGTVHNIGGSTIEQINLLIRSLAHVLAFGGLGLMIILGCLLSKFETKMYIILTLGLGSIIALTDETIKLFVPGRHFNWIDAGKDVVGLVLALIGSWILSQLYIVFQKRRRPKTT